MKTTLLPLAFIASVFLLSCGSSEDKKSTTNEDSAKPDAAALAKTYCDCLDTAKTEEDMDNCGKISIDHTADLAIHTEALKAYNEQTEACTNAFLEKMVNRAMEELDELEAELDEDDLDEDDE